jgi:DNA (cytosine-5)-methyltransferase 1
MRKWPGFPSDGYVRDHVIRYTPRDYETFRRMKPGDQYPEAYAVAESRFAEALATFRPKPKLGTKAYVDLRAAIVPPYDPHKFPNKWRKMERDQPVRTIPAHIGKDSYSHIHYDSSQARSISVREAARLQSFPDGFTFSGRMNSAFHQIGDSVPPLLAYAIGKSMIRQLTRGLKQTDRLYVSA